MSFLKRISKGGFGVVYKVEEKETGELFAAKIIDCDDDEKMCNQMIRREITIMMYARHPTIIKFIGYSKQDFQEENNVTVIMELAKNGSLKDVLKKIQDGCGPQDFTNTSRQIIIVGVARGMKYLHDRSIIHRDLKTDNILLDDDFHPHITDFGLSKFIEAGHTRSQTKFGGTLLYEAPEILRGVEYDQKVDVYSFGILLFEILTDSVPYPELEQQEIAGLNFISKIVQENYRPKFNVPVKKSFKQLIEKCWSENPEERPTFGEIFTILTSKNIEENEEENFMLDDVDVDEFNLYVEDITEITDGTEKLLSKISEMESEIKKLKSENRQLKKDLEETDNLKLEIERLKEENQKYKNIIAKHDEDVKKLPTMKEESQKHRNIIAKHDDDMKKLPAMKEESQKHRSIIAKHDEDVKKLPAMKEESQKHRSIIAKHDEDVKKLPTKGTSAKKQFTQSIIVGGLNEYNGLGIKSNNESKYNQPIISPPLKLSFDPSSLLSYSTYNDHSVLVMSDGSLKGVGNNSDGRISSTLQKTVINDFTDFCINDGSGRQLSAVSAVCYFGGTLYIFSKSRGNERQLVLCDEGIKGGEPVFLDIGNHYPVSLFGGSWNSAAIGSEGEVIFIDHSSVKNSPNSQIEAVYLPDGEKASSVACCNSSVVVLSSNGRIFFSKIESKGDLNFSIVSELSCEEIISVSGTDLHFLAVSKKGHVFGYGSNLCGQLGLGKKIESVSSFTEISSLSRYKIRAAYAGAYHSLFETKEGKIFSCGDNYNGELLGKIAGERVYSPKKTAITSGASFCIAGFSISAVLIGSGPPPNTPNARIL